MESTASIYGHPFHAMMIGYPVALFTVALALDLIYYARGRDRFWAQCSYVVLIFGVLGTTASLIPGLIDYYTMPMPRPLSTRHLVAGIALTLVYAIQVLVRRPRTRDEAPRVTLLFNLLGVALLVYQGWLGGELVDRWRVGIIPAPAAPAAASASPVSSSASTLPAKELATAKSAFQANCAACHKAGGSGGDIGPSLEREGATHDSMWISIEIKNPLAHSPKGQMPPFNQLPPAQIQAMSDWLASLK